MTTLWSAAILSLNDIAKKALIDRGFNPEFPKSVLNQLSQIDHSPPPLPPFKEMRGDLWCSIDNDDSLDLDQLTLATDDKIYVAIADVDSLVKKATPIDLYAAHNTTSVYTPGAVFPMLHPKLSTQLTSLNPQSDRAAIVVEMKIDDSGSTDLLSVYPAYVSNKAKLSYQKLASWLEDKAPYPALENVQGLKEQLLLQDRHAQKMKKFRESQGALFFASIELEPVVSKGLVVELKEKRENRAQQLIEYFMIAANTAATEFLKKNRLPCFKRVVRTPKRWDRIVAIARSFDFKLPPQPDGKALQLFLKDQRSKNIDKFPDLCLAIIKLIGRGEYTLDPQIGHFDLALRNYAHATAPNRRFPDLIMQRLIKSSFLELPIPYSRLELNFLARHCTEKENDASKIQRQMVKSAAAFILKDQIGKKFEAMVTGIKGKNTWIRIKHPPVEGKLIKGFEGLDVGDHIHVQLLEVNIPYGHIDFKKASLA